ncbi:two-component system sensor histidine kinase CreC [Corticibacter populi]|uniref:histidine kinase n=1 Tax=Corticibacter populi TaxID=1550736 RepID=A0A3M6QP82_9BURK|nr:two-component system sensor histidine kinase CreC [Corticibacter populi]RMX04202.1 two-component system sensor histidine kinase CreC [Corticibacter populi]RZS33229.1 two-component system sensor histidine kinase CreC [Corticibacter populi]
MNIAIRLFIGYFLIVGLAAWFVLGFFSREVEPGVRQGTEDTLVDAANLLAEILAPQIAAGGLEHSTLVRAVAAAQVRQPAANIHGNAKDSIDLRLYITDAQGIVRFDSEFKDVGRDYSRWRDVLLALRGEYGARSTREDPASDRSSVMYVAAPVIHQGALVGVLALGKPMRSVEMYADTARRRVRELGFIMLLASAGIGLLFTWWLTHSLNQLRNYARAVAEGDKVRPPIGGGRQLSELARALEHMREKLDGKQYVEQYVQSLTHEMKSPLTAIRGAAELLPEAPAAEQQRFTGHILEQTERLQRIIDRLLALARVEQLQAPASMSANTTRALVEAVLASRQTRIDTRRIQVSVQEHGAMALTVHGDQFLLQQALGNVLDNALDFTPPGGRIDIHIEPAASPAGGRRQRIRIRDHGSGVPPYALPHLFERFYSLPRPDTGRKSTGLGLAFVREVARIHGGTVQIANATEGGTGAEVCLVLPLGAAPPH